MRKYQKRNSKRSSKMKKNYRTRRNKNSRKIRRTKKHGGGDMKTHIIKLWASWCGHCVSMNEIWPDVVSAVDSKHVMFHAVESADMKGDNSELHLKNKELKTDKIKVMAGYPTLLKMKNDLVTNYEGPRDKDSLIKWIKE